VVKMAGELRFDRHVGQWVNIAGHRQARPNLPDDGCPFCVGGLEAPEPYDTRWFANRWPAFETGPAPDLAAAIGTGTDVAPARGAAEVILYSSRHEGSLGSLGVQQVTKVVKLWGERTAELLTRPEVEYVLVFESRGAEVGATIHHPHGQIYGYPFVPPSPAAERGRAVEVGSDPVADEVERELTDGRRIVHDGGDWIAWVPFASPYSYGLRLAPRSRVGRLDHLDDQQAAGLAEALCDVLGRYDRLWAGAAGASDVFPYLMWFHQGSAEVSEFDHLHVHLAPPQRAPGLHRFLAAGEVGSGTFSNPVEPEAAAEALRLA
jgi:UDPglucose--hexose-1-phosphate uridylyltransferase